MEKLNANTVVKQAGPCLFNYLRAGFAYYTLDLIDNERGYITTYMFSIPLDDIGNGSLGKQEKALTLMRWIRKAIDNNEFILISQTVPDFKETINN